MLDDMDVTLSGGRSGMLGARSVVDDSVTDTTESQGCVSLIDAEGVAVDDDSEFPKDEPHVIVVGGGPAGLLTAILLLQRGIHVTILEKLPVSKEFL